MFRLGAEGVQSQARDVRPAQTYMLLRIGPLEFAYSAGDRYLRALGQSWAAGLLPDPLPSVMGSDLTSASHRLSGVDLELTRVTVAKALLTR